MPQGKTTLRRASTPSSKKSTDAELYLRVSKVYNLLLIGIGRAEICQYASTNWGVSDRQTDRYIEKANEEFKRQSFQERTLQFGKTSARLDRLFALAMKDEDTHQALVVLKENSNLYRLNDHGIEKIEERISALERIKKVKK